MDCHYLQEPPLEGHLAKAYRGHHFCMWSASLQRGRQA